METNEDSKEKEGKGDKEVKKRRKEGVLKKEEEKEGSFKGMAGRKGAGVVPGRNKAGGSFLMFFEHGSFPVDFGFDNFFNELRDKGSN